MARQAVAPKDGGPVRVVVWGTPIPQGSMKAFMPRGGRFPVVTADNKKTKPWRQAIIDACLEMHFTMTEQPVRLDIQFHLPRPKSLKKSVLRPAKKPDLDKLVRAVCDALTAAGVWRDDSQVVALSAIKRFAGEGFAPCAHIEVLDL